MPDPKIPIDSEELLLLGLTPKQLVFMANCMTCVVNLGIAGGDDVPALVRAAQLLLQTQRQAHDIGRKPFLAMMERIKALIVTTDIPIESFDDAFPDRSQN